MPCLRPEIIQHFEGPFGEDIANVLEPAGYARSTVSTDINEVLNPISDPPIHL